MVLVWLETYELRVSQETVRRWLQKEQIVWRRPCPVVGPSDPQKEKKLSALRQLLATLPANEIAVFQDAVDVNTNPKIGAMWMRRGRQATVVTPGTNEKRYLAGSLNWRTGALIRKRLICGVIDRDTETERRLVVVSNRLGTRPRPPTTVASNKCLRLRYFRDKSASVQWSMLASCLLLSHVLLDRRRLSP